MENSDAVPEWFERRHGGSNLWQVDTGDGKSPNSKLSSIMDDVDEQEADVEAPALEKIPRAHTAMLEEEEEEHATKQQQPPPLPVDFGRRRRLARRAQRQQQRVLQKVFGTAGQDNERLLKRIKERLDRVGMELPTVEVRFENLSVSADVVHVGSRSLPTLTNFVRNIVEKSLAAVNALPAAEKQELAILRNISGVIKPGRMALLLGPPGAGKSTLLQAVGGKLDSGLRCGGKITYNGHSFSEFVPQRTSAYISQSDNHIAELTVRETLDFAARCQGLGLFVGNEMLTELRRREKQENIRPDPDIDAFMKAMETDGNEHNSLSTEYVMKVLGLETCGDTLVGSDMLRGISGGQKKRVTTGEMVVGPKKVLFMDEISTGLDSSTTYQIVKCLANFAHLLQGTVLMALLQPAPETFELFDDVILISEGYIVYQGPRDRILEFFESLGFAIPPRKGIADFLQEVTSSKDQEQYWADKSKPYQFLPVPRMAKAFTEFHTGSELHGYLSLPFDKSARSHPPPPALANKRYVLHKWALLKACAEREILLISRNRFLYIFKTCQVLTPII